MQHDPRVRAINHALVKGCYDYPLAVFSDVTGLHKELAHAVVEPDLDPAAGNARNPRQADRSGRSQAPRRGLPWRDDQARHFLEGDSMISDRALPASLGVVSKAYRQTSPCTLRHADMRSGESLCPRADRDPGLIRVPTRIWSAP